MLLHEMLIQQAADDGIPDKDMQEFKDAAIFDIQNVADFYWQHPQDVWDLSTDFPNMAPPFPIFWAEHTFPRRIHADGREIDYSGKMRPGMKLGVLVHALRVPEDVGPTWEGDESKWRLVCRYYLGHKHDTPTVWGGNIGCQLGVKADGSLAQLEGEQGFFRIFLPNDIEANEVSQTWREALSQYIKPVMLAVSFLHCKNVIIVGHEIKPRRRKGNRGQAARQLGTVTYHTINIHPLRDILRREGGATESTGLKRAVRACRGHFKDYRNGRGLFGKHKGIFWWSDPDDETRRDYKIDLD